MQTMLEKLSFIKSLQSLHHRRWDIKLNKRRISPSLASVSAHKKKLISKNKLYRRKKKKKQRCEFNDLDKKVKHCIKDFR
jgi:hypothetical protein